MEEIQNGGTATPEIAGDDTQSVSENQVENTTDESSVENAKEEKMFTQAEVNKFLEERVARIKREPNFETAHLKETVEMLQNQLAQYEKELAQSKYNIDPEYLDYVDYKVSHSVDNNNSYEDVLKAFLETEGKKYIREKQEARPTPRPDNQSGKPQDEMRAYLQAKYNIKI